MTALAKGVAWTTATGTISGAVRGGFNNGWSGAWNGAKNAFSNSIKIWGSPFSGNGAQSISRMTWELPQSLAGIGLGLGLNIKGDIKNISNYRGTIHIETNSSNWGGVSLGGNFSTHANPTEDLKSHEWGHTVQSSKFGYGYIQEVGIPSLISAQNCSIDDHSNKWYEKQATKYGNEYNN